MLERDNKGLDEIVRRRLPVVTSCPTCTTPGCCYQKVISPFVEALPIARQIRDEGRDTPELRAELRAEGERIELAGRAQWMREARPCAFLADGRCTVYRNRPFACRTYYVMSDPANCQPSAPDGKVKFVNTVDLMASLLERAMIFHTRLGLRPTRARILIGALPRLVAIALEAWDLDHDAFAEYVRRQKWPTASDLEAGWIEGEHPSQNTNQEGSL